MFAVKAVLTPPDVTAATELSHARQLAPLARHLLSTSPSAVAHVTLRHTLAGLTAMLFVEARHLRAAETLARDACHSWLGEERLRGWSLARCEGDLFLTVEAANEYGSPPGW